MDLSIRALGSSTIVTAFAAGLVFGLLIFTPSVLLIAFKVDILSVTYSFAPVLGWLMSAIVTTVYFRKVNTQIERRKWQKKERNFLLSIWGAGTLLGLVTCPLILTLIA